MIWINDISMLPNDWKPYAAIGFARDPSNRTDARGQSHIKYLTANAAKLVSTAFEEPALLKLMLDERCIKPSVIQIYLDEADRTKRPEIKAMLLEYTEQQRKKTDPFARLTLK